MCITGLDAYSTTPKIEVLAVGFVVIIIYFVVYNI